MSLFFETVSSLLTIFLSASHSCTSTPLTFARGAEIHFSNLLSPCLNGMKMTNVVPSPCLLNTSTVPHMASTICLVKASPMPVPVETSDFEWKNGSKTCGRSSGFIPHPVSCTLILILLSTILLLMVTLPPLGVNFSELKRRFVRILYMKSGTKSIFVSFSSDWYSISMRFFMACGRTLSTTISMKAVISPVFQSALPIAERTFAISNSWFTRVSSLWLCLDMASISIIDSFALALDLSSSTHPRITVRGVRNSWVTFVKNSCLARPAFFMTFCIFALILNAYIREEIAAVETRVTMMRK